MKSIQYSAPSNRYPLCKDAVNLLDIGKAAAKTVVSLVPNEDIVLIGTGTSGAMMMVALANGLISNKRRAHCILIKKESESTHRWKVEAPDTVRSTPAVFVVDDEVSTGSTLESILKHIERGNISYSIPVGARWETTAISNNITGIILADSLSTGISKGVMETLQRRGVKTTFDFLITRQ